MLLPGGCAAAGSGVSDVAGGLTSVAELVSLEFVRAVRRVATGLAGEHAKLVKVLTSYAIH